MPPLVARRSPPTLASFYWPHAHFAPPPRIVNGLLRFWPISLFGGWFEERMDRAGTQRYPQRSESGRSRRPHQRTGNARPGHGTRIAVARSSGRDRHGPPPRFCHPEILECSETCPWLRSRPSPRVPTSTGAPSACHGPQARVTRAHRGQMAGNALFPPLPWLQEVQMAGGGHPMSP